MSGNGKKTPPVSIDMVQMGSDWIYFEPGEVPPGPKELPLLLNRTVTDWLQRNPAAVVRGTLPISAGGATVGIHVWYEQRSE